MKDIIHNPRLFKWSPSSNACAYMISWNDPHGNQRLIVVPPDITKFSVTEDLSSAYMRLSVLTDVVKEKIFHGELLAERKIAFECMTIQPSIETASINDYEIQSIERFPIIGFEASPYSEIKVLNSSFELKWEIPRHSFASEIHLTGESGNKLKVLVRGDRVSIDTATLKPGKYAVYARSLFRQGWGKFVPGPKLVVTNSKEQYVWVKDSGFQSQSAENFLISAAGRSFAENKSILLREMAENKSVLSAFPSSICIMLGYNCNIDCVMCDEGRVKRSSKTPRSLIDEVTKYALPFLTDLELVGGEPLLYSEAEQIADQAEKYPQCKISLYTNATALIGKWQDRIANGNYNLRISMDGATAETYEKIRRKAKFAQVTDNISKTINLSHRLGNKNIFTEINFVIMKENISEIVPMVQLASDLGCSAVWFKLLENPGNEPSLAMIDPTLSKEDCRKIVENIRHALGLGKTLGVQVYSRALPRILNHYPSLAVSSEEAYMVPVSNADFTRSHAANSQVRSDFAYRDTMPIEDALSHIRRLRGSVDKSPRPSKELDGFLAKERIENPLKQLITAQFCDFPFTTLYLDTYRSYVCCDANAEYLYGNPYHQVAPRLWDVWNSALMQKARNKMYTNRFGEVCGTRCKYFAGGGTCKNLKKIALCESSDGGDESE